MNYATGGLFGYVGNGGKVSNVSVLDSYFSASGDVGGICGSNEGTVTNCYNAGMINKPDGYKYDFGGVCGFNSGTIIDCYNTGNVSGIVYTGGVCGDNGGTIINCYNTGDVNGKNYVGGVCGDNYRGTITNCYNTGDVNGEQYIGGVSGFNRGTTTNCYTIGDVTGNQYIGSVSGFNTGTFTNCYYDSTIYTENVIGNNSGTAINVEGKTTEQYKSGEIAYLLQGDQTEEVWGQNIGTDNYPILGGKKVYQNKEYDSCDENGNVVTITYSNEQGNKFTHTLVKVEAVGYCTKEGTDIYWECSECGKMSSDENAENEIISVPVLAPLGHNYGLSVETSEDGTTSSVVFTCKRENCKESDNGHREAVTITAPDKAGLIFNGNAKEATVTRTSQNVPENIPDIVYTGDGLLNGKPVNAGTYKASITIGDGKDTVTASVTYEIVQATPVIGIVSADSLNDTLDVSKVELRRSDNTLSGTLKLKDDTKLKYGTNEYNYVFTPDDSNYKAIEGTVNITVNDTIAPTASYKIGTDDWKKFINTITFGKFCKDYQTVEIIYSDKAADRETDGSGIAKKQYYVSDKEIENPVIEITDEMWKDYKGTFHLDAKGRYFIYVRVSDNAGNEIIQNSEGVVIYAESNISPIKTEYIYKENTDLEFNIVLNENTFNKMTDETGKDLPVDSYTVDTDGKLTLKAAYLDTLTSGTYTYKLYMNPQGVPTDKVELVYTFTITVKQAEITVTGAIAEDRPYDSTSNKVNISVVTIAGVGDGDNVLIDTTNLQGTLSSANAGSYTEVILPELTLTGTDAANYKLVQPEGAVALSDKVTISKLNAQITVRTESYDKTYGDAAFLLDVEKNTPESEIGYTITSGTDVISVENGTVTIKKAGTATIKLSLEESQNYNVAEDKVITVNVAKKTGFTVDTINRSYLYLRENKENIDLTGLLPRDCGQVTYGNPVTSGDVTYSIAPKIENGVLTYVVNKGIAGNDGNIQITVITDNYADINITVYAELIDQIPVVLQSGSKVSLKNSVITYGETLSKMLFDDAVFVDTDGKKVKGTLEWKKPYDKPDAGTTSATWIFTPDNEEYASLEGEAVITVKKAVPQITELPAVADRIYNPSKALVSSDLIDGTVTDVNGDLLAGTWNWQSREIIPVVNNTGYVAVFTPKDTTNYEQVTRTITVKVTKATPVITVKPSATEITYGDSLGESALTGGTVTYSNSDNTAVAGAFTWKDAAIKPVVADSNSKEFVIIFTPTDTVNYETAETEITINVRRLPVAPNIPGNILNVSNTTKKISEISLPENWVWQDADKDTTLEVGRTVTATAIYVGADKGNYETESIEINITRSACEHKNTEIRNIEEATCEHTGYTGDTYCTDCDVKLVSGTVTEALGHSYTSEITKNPTTKEDGEMTYTCSRCGHTYTETIEKLPDNGNDDANNDDINKDNTNKDDINKDNINKDNTSKDNSDKTYIKDDNSKTGKTNPNAYDINNRDKKNSDSGSKAPKTGDSAWRSLWIILLGSVVLVIGLGRCFINKKKELE